MKLAEIKKVKTYEDLQKLSSSIGSIYNNVGDRGGGLGFYATDVANAVGVFASDLPRYFGAGCNYLGGGVRGSIFPSSFNDRISGRKREILEALANACVRVYEYVENEDRMNDDFDNDEPNWEAQATKVARSNGIISAY